MYTPVSDKEEHEASSSSSSSSTGHDDIEGLLSSEPQTRFLSYASPNKLLYILLPITSILSIVLGVFLNQVFFPIPSPDANKICPPHVQHYSPVLKEVDTKLHIQHFNGSFMHLNAFRGEAGPETDAAWESLGVNYRGIQVPYEEGLKSGFRKDQVKINQKYGGGFPANVEGLHHLHCLNLLRQSLYHNYDYYKKEGKGAFKNEEHIVKAHVTHCMDIIRQQLMCQPDTGLLGQVWWDTSYPRAFVDFNTEHKCKNFEAIREWAKVRQLPENVQEDFLQPPQMGDLVYEEIP